MFDVLGTCHVEIWVQRPCATVYPYWADKNVGTVTASVMASNAHADMLCQTIKINACLYPFAAGCNKTIMHTSRYSGQVCLAVLS